MRNNFKGKDFLSFMDYNKEELEYLVELTLLFKKKFHCREPHEYLKGQSWAAVFEKNSTRTRNSVERAGYDLGINVVYQTSDNMQTKRGEPLKDTARILDRYYDGLFIRTFGQEIVNEYAYWMKHPVINGLTSEEHPTQGLADIATIWEKKKTFKGLKFCFTGDVWNVANTSMMEAATLGMDFYMAKPDCLDGPPEYLLEEAKKRAAWNGSKLIITPDFDEALKDADVVYTATHYSMGQPQEIIDRQREAFKPYIVTLDQLKKCDKDVIYMHCLPAHRGDEVTDEVMESPYSVIFDEGENRMHSIKAIMAAIALG